MEQGQHAAKEAVAARTLGQKVGWNQGVHSTTALGEVGRGRQVKGTSYRTMLKPAEGRCPSLGTATGRMGGG